MRVLGKGEISQLSGFAFGEDECNALIANRWQGPNGDSALVPIGDYSEVHHSTCFRMWNMEREIAAHGLTKSNLPLTLPTANWIDLQRLAKDLSEDAAASPDKPASLSVSVAARRAAGGNCIFGKK
jgi:hypothetical protein